MNPLLKKPSAWLPVVMSLAALGLLVGYLATFGVSREPETDEGTAAHLFQLLMAGQVPIVAVFAIKWLPRAPKEALQVLAFQVTAALAAFLLLYFLER